MSLHPEFRSTPEPESPQSSILEKMKQANVDRDQRVYHWRMDGAGPFKVESILEVMRVNDGGIIVDAGSGTGVVLQHILEELHKMGFSSVQGINLDLSHEHYEASSQHPLTKLAFGDAAEINFPENSINVMYYSTSGHEICSFGGGKSRMSEAIRNAFFQLAPGGQLIIRDFVKPSLTEPIFKELPENDGQDCDPHTPSQAIDYNNLSTMAKFKRFHAEFAGGHAFEYQELTVEGKKVIQLDPEWAYEFYMRKEYTGNWRNEIHEKYSYWTMEEAQAELEAAGFVQVQVKPENSQYMLDNWLVGKIQLYQTDESGNMRKLPFPPTHMKVVGYKPALLAQTDTEGLGTEQVAPQTAQVELHDFDQIMSSIHLDLDAGVVTFRSDVLAGAKKELPDKTFKVDPATIHHGHKFTTMELIDSPGRVLKIPNLERLATQSLGRKVNTFKALYQTVSRQGVLDQYGTAHLRIYEVDPSGPPYRYLVQEALPEQAVCIADVVRRGELSEQDIRQICEVVTRYEQDTHYQLDTSPYAWYKVQAEDGTSRLLYAPGKVYLYDEQWEFRKIGLLQWTDATFLPETELRAALVPKKQDQLDLFTRWFCGDPDLEVWRRFLPAHLQPVAVVPDVN